MSQATGVGAVLRRIELFSRHVLGMPLYEYQLAPLRAILESVLKEHGHDFLLIFPRQSGKNEAVAHLFVYLLNLLQRSGGSIVFAAIGDGVGRGLRRLEERLDNRWNRGQWTKSARPLRRALGKAGVLFLSSHPQAYARGETARWLLVVDELQDNDAQHLEAVFEPMRAAYNATAVYLGTVRFSSDALWQKRQQLERQQAADGVQRVFLVPPHRVTRENKAYARFLQRKTAQLGHNHPIIKSEYYLQPIDAEGGLFPPRRRKLMRGRHPRLDEPRDGHTYVATLDVGGQDEGATSALAQLKNPARDYTVATVFELERAQRTAPGPTYRAVDVFVDHGSRHFQEGPGRPSLVQRLVAFLQRWRAAHVVGDATGVGEGVLDWLAAALGPSRVTPFRFTARSKAQLGNRFLSVVETGRFRYWAADGNRRLLSDDGPQTADGALSDEPPLSDAWWFWQQCAHCIYEMPEGGTPERSLSWGVPASASISTPAGPKPVHDDRLVSAMLVAQYDELVQQGALRLGEGHSAVIKPRDVMRDLRF